MNAPFKKTRYPFVLLATLPLLILGGCAGQDTTKAREESSPSVTETSKSRTEIQDPIAMQNSQVTDMAGENTNINTALNEDNHAVSTTTEEVALFPPASKPQEQRIGFGFDQTEVDSQYHELLKQHAQYLAENKDMILKLNGHTDSYGPKEYNQQLSNLRAEAVAKLLVEYGAPEERLMIKGVADDEPLPSATRQSENRRVELDYQDQRLVSVD